MSGKYSLEALRTLRAARQEALDLELAERGRELERRRLEAAEQRAALDRLGSERRKAREGEAEALARDGGLRAAELVHGFQHETGQIAEEERQRVRVQSAQSEAQQALSERERVAEALRVARAESEAVERHRERWDHERARKAEESEDESATERWNAKHFGPGRS